jgi:hypothetical protein
MKSVVIKPINLIDKPELPEVSVNQIPVEGDPIEINGEMFYVCESSDKEKPGFLEIGVIPLVVRNPAKVLNIENYIKCLSIAHRKVQFKNEKGSCDLNNCDEMIIS